MFRSVYEPCLSPSIYHRRLMDQIKPSMSYTAGDVVAWQRRLRRKVGELLGFSIGTKAPLHTQVIWQREHELGRIEKVRFAAEPGADVVAYLCLPKSAPPYRTFICLQGHTTGMHNSIARQQVEESKPMDVSGDRDFGIGCMKRGLAALCIEQRCFGERREAVQKQISSHGCHDAAMHALMLGKTLVGERVLDVERGLDYLQSRGDIDMKRIGVMGNSGGATVTIYAAALLPRLAYAMPSCGFCTYRDSIMSIYHCVDNYVPRIMLYAEMADVLGLFAPRPLVVVAGKSDEIFPIAGVRKAFAKLKAIYRAAGAERSCHLVVGPEGHRYYAELGWKKMLAEMRI